MFSGDVIEKRGVVRIGTEQPGGELLVADLYIRPGGAVMGEHFHPAIEERFTVLRGRGGFRLSGRDSIAEPGVRLIATASRTFARSFLPSPALHRTAAACSVYRVQRPLGRAAGNCEPVRVGSASEALNEYVPRCLRGTAADGAGTAPAGAAAGRGPLDSTGAAGRGEPLARRFPERTLTRRCGRRGRPNLVCGASFIWGAGRFA